MPVHALWKIYDASDESKVQLPPGHARADLLLAHMFVTYFLSEGRAALEFVSQQDLEVTFTYIFTLIGNVLSNTTGFRPFRPEPGDGPRPTYQSQPRRARAAEGLCHPPHRPDRTVAFVGRRRQRVLPGVLPSFQNVITANAKFHGNIRYLLIDLAITLHPPSPVPRAFATRKYLRMKDYCLENGHGVVGRDNIVEPTSTPTPATEPQSKASKTSAFGVASSSLPPAMVATSTDVAASAPPEAASTSVAQLPPNRDDATDKAAKIRFLKSTFDEYPGHPDAKYWPGLRKAMTEERPLTAEPPHFTPMQDSRQDVGKVLEPYKIVTAINNGTPMTDQIGDCVYQILHAKGVVNNKLNVENKNFRNFPTYHFRVPDNDITPLHFMRELNALYPRLNWTIEKVTIADKALPAEDASITHKDDVFYASTLSAPQGHSGPIFETEEE
ncbi:hypothetical protein TI39_contig620g00004 [Zymoseptoria brevis]|uniref:Uncharacterized protein n=1 Tax=Zymoseptoria brevis TaxID=1047168 RepID=A0A0F4GHK6_9PEZI|nr:hypothetical protein TI39_contig620g00004 [Zymoseptoria brevis]